MSLFFAYKSYFFYLNNNSSDSFLVIFIPLMFWISIIFVIKIFKLKYIEVRDKDILVSSLWVKKIINYEDIEWVHINDRRIANKESIILIKYKNVNTNKFNTIYFLSKTETKTNGIISENISNELEMTKFIKERIVNVKPEYRTINEPIGWYQDKIYFIALIPAILVFIYLLVK